MQVEKFYICLFSVKDPFTSISSPNIGNINLTVLGDHEILTCIKLPKPILKIKLAQTFYSYVHVSVHVASPDVEILAAIRTTAPVCGREPMIWSGRHFYKICNQTEQEMNMFHFLCHTSSHDIIEDILVEVLPPHNTAICEVVVYNEECPV